MTLSYLSRAIVSAENHVAEHEGIALLLRNLAQSSIVEVDELLEFREGLYDTSTSQEGRTKEAREGGTNREESSESSFVHDLRINRPITRSSDIFVVLLSEEAVAHPLCDISELSLRAKSTQRLSLFGRMSRVAGSSALIRMRFGRARASPAIVPTSLRSVLLVVDTE